MTYASAEGNTGDITIARCDGTLRGLRPVHVRKFLAWKPGGNRRSYRDPAHEERDLFEQVE
jgi:hypothetical protein